MTTDAVTKTERGSSQMHAYRLLWPIAMALDRLFSHGKLTLITIFCCSNTEKMEERNAISLRKLREAEELY
jgi:hypothetical protein